MIGLDHRLEHWAVAHRTGWLDPIFVGLSWIGTDGAVWIVVALVLAVLWRRARVLVTTLVAVALADLLAYALKETIGRDRPPLHGVRALVHVPGTGSFPSGHAATAFAGATVLALAVPRLAAPAFVLAAAIAYSRVYDGVHYPADVVAGALLGVLLALLCVRALPRLGRVLRRSGPVPRPG